MNPTQQRKSDNDTQISLLTQQVTMFIQQSATVSADHEARLRKIEAVASNLELLITKLDGKLDTEVGIIKGRNVTLNIIQAAFTSIAAFVAAVFRK